ncbi:MAG: hypothetical protein ACJA1W_004475 [Akkermansiaceae bacterium]|jgi:hypothetical protein
MKSTILSLIVLSTLLATVITRSQTQNDNFDPLGEQNDLPRMIRVHAEFIEMPHATYTKLMAKPRASANDTDLRAECAKLVTAGEAGVLESLCVTALPGQNATVESITEFIYPTEYEPAELPNKVADSNPPETTTWAGPPTPSAYDTKNLGSTFEVEAQIDGSLPIVDLRLTPTIVYHVDNVTWGTFKTEEAEVKFDMPSFYVLTVKTGANLVAGQTTMLAALSPKNEKGFTDTSHKVMLFVRADIIITGK